VRVEVNAETTRMPLPSPARAGGCGASDDRQHSTLAAYVEQSSHPQWKHGDKVIAPLGAWVRLISELRREGGVKGEWLVRLRRGWHATDAMAIGTAGFTAMLAAARREKQGLTPKDGA